MAKLEEIAALMNVKIPSKSDFTAEKATGRKRRPWIDETFISTSPTLPSQLSNSDSYKDEHENVICINDIKNRVHNKEQTGYKLGTERDTNWVQTGYKTEHKQGTNRVQTGYRTERKSGTNRVQTRYTNGYKLSPIDCFSSISGVQRNLIISIYNECKNNRSIITNPLSLEYLASSVKSNKNTVKTTLKRLEKKNLITRDSYKEGRGGWTKYRLSNSLYQELLQYESTKLDTETGTNWVQTEYKLGTEQDTELGTQLSSSSSILNITTTTQQIAHDDETEQHRLDLVNLEPLTSIGFTENHFTQLTKVGIHSFEMIQDAIYAFSYDLQKKAVNPKNPLNMFMSVMKKGLYAPASPDYENPQVKAMRLYLEKRKGIEQEKAKLEEELIKEHFLIWKTSLSDDDKNILLSEGARNSSLRAYKTSELQIYHKKQIWPDARDSFYRERGLASF